LGFRKYAKQLRENTVNDKEQNRKKKGLRVFHKKSHKRGRKWVRVRKGGGGGKTERGGGPLHETVPPTEDHPRERVERFRFGKVNREKGNSWESGVRETRLSRL